MAAEPTRSGSTAGVQDVGLPEKAGQGRVERPLVDAGGRVELGDHAVAQHGHLVGHGQGLVLVVGDQDRRRAGPAQHVVHLGAHAGAQAGVERGEGLVEQDDLGVGGQGAGQRNALLLATRELVG